MLAPEHLRPERLAGLFIDALQASRHSGSEEAIAHNKRAKELDPLTPFIRIDLGWAYNHARRYDEAIATAGKALAIADAAKNDRESRQIRQRLELYRSRMPYRLSQ